MIRKSLRGSRKFGGWTNSKGFLLKVGQSDQLSRAWDEEFDLTFRVVRYQQWWFWRNWPSDFAKTGPYKDGDRSPRETLGEQTSQRSKIRIWSKRDSLFWTFTRTLKYMTKIFHHPILEGNLCLQIVCVSCTAGSSYCHSWVKYKDTEAHICNL